MEFVKDILPELGLSALIPLFLVFVKTGIDTFNITGVEKSILTDSKKISMYLSQINIFSSIFTSIIFIYMIFKEPITFDIVEIAVRIVVIYIFIFSFTLTLLFTLLFFVSLVTIKLIFYIQEDGNWMIRRRIDNKKLLMINDNGSYKFVDAACIMNKEIFVKLNKSKENCFIYDKFIEYIKIFKIVTIIVIALQFIGSIIITVFFANLDDIIKIVLLIVILLSLVFLLYISVVENNERIKEFYNSKSNVKDNEA